MSPSSDTASATLTIHLDAIRANWRILRDRFTGGETAAVVKANAYGLGVDHVAPALWEAGARTFFVATLDEGIRLRKLLTKAHIHILNGLLPRTEGVFAEHALVPVLNDLGQVALWRDFSARNSTLLPADLHIDTGMLRLGLPGNEVERLATDPSLLGNLDIRFVLSHLASADEAASPQNEAQLNRLRATLARLPLGTASVSFCNSAGLFLGADYHFELARPGIALYGANPTPGAANPMRPVVSLSAKILQIRDVDAPETVGYGATHRVTAPGRIATVGVGYADGYLRSLSNRGQAHIDGIRVPVIGRVSMDLITLDVTHVPDAALRGDAPVHLISPEYDIDAVAADAGTIAYEILTGLGKRYHRVYLDEGSPS